MTHRHPCLMQAMAAVNQRKASAGASTDGEPTKIDIRLIMVGLEEVDHAELVDAMALVATANYGIIRDLIEASTEEDPLDLTAVAATTATAFAEGLTVGLMLCHLRQEVDR